LVYNNTIINIPDLSEALYLRDGTSEQNTLHSNTLIGINGQRISLDELQITIGAEDSSENNTGNNDDDEEEDNDNDSGDGEGESDSNNDGETSGSNGEVE
jgi:mannuronan 5-epimerase